MKRLFYAAALLAFSVAAACGGSPNRSGRPSPLKLRFQRAGQNADLEVRKIFDSCSQIFVRTYQGTHPADSSFVLFTHPLYDLQLGDIDGDGEKEICVGVTKPTPHDPAMRRRLFVYRITGGRIVPMWRGTRIGGELLNFRVVHDTGADRIRTIEQQPGGACDVAEYRWNTFGFKKINYLGRNLSYANARKLLD